MQLASRTRRARLALAALALLVFAGATTVAGAALWLHGHGGFAAGVTSVARQAAFLAGALERLPGTLPLAQAAALAPPAPAVGWVWAAGGDGARDFSFALIEPGSSATVCFDLDVNSEGFRHARRAATVPTLWFTDDGAEYVVTDAATVARARALCAPLSEIGSEMGKVGGRQGEIGAKLGRAGGRLGALGGRLGGLSARLATTRVSAAERTRMEAELEQVQAEMERAEAEMERTAAGSEAEQAELSRRMSELSARHEAALAKTRAGLRQLIDEARASGKATRLGASI